MQTPPPSRRQGEEPVMTKADMQEVLAGVGAELAAIKDVAASELAGATG